MTVRSEARAARSQESLVADGWQPLEAVGYTEFVGQVYFRSDGESMRYGFIAEERHKNRRSVIHGGVLAAFADRALALAGRRVNNNMPQATIELSVRFVDAAHIGEFIETAPEVVRKTRSVIFVRGILTAGGRAVASADGIWKILAPPKTAS
jgi:uncharacterized protein (TIGR00369 family)